MSADLRTGLSDADLTALRAAFDEPALGHMLVAGVGSQNPLSNGYSSAIANAFYEPHEDVGSARPPAPLLDGRARELILVSMLLAQRGAGFDVATHFYLALMSGASLDDLCATLLLAGAYAGMPCLSDGNTLLHITLQVLATVAAGEARDPRTVLGALHAAFPMGKAPVVRPRTRPPTEPARSG